MGSKVRYPVLMAVLLVAGFVYAGESAHGDFRYSEEKDPFTDEDRSFAYMLADGATEERTGSLAWKCMDDGLNVLYMFDRYFGGDADDEVRVRYRIDSEPAYGPEYWGLLEGHRTTWMPMDEIRQFTASARAGTRIIFEVVDPLDGERLTDSFSLKGAGAAIDRLACARESGVQA